MNKFLLVVLLGLGFKLAMAQTGPACIYSPAELSAALGHTPQAGVGSKDRLGSQHCSYVGKDSPGRKFWVHVKPKCDQQRFETHAKTMQSTSGKPNKPLSGVGDGAYFSPGGTAAVRVGAQCVELSGLRTGAMRVITEAEAAQLLTLAASRVKN
jgi:hypothetical protein